MHDGRRGGVGVYLAAGFAVFLIMAFSFAALAFGVYAVARPAPEEPVVEPSTTTTSTSSTTTTSTVLDALPLPISSSSTTTLKVVWDDETTSTTLQCGGLYQRACPGNVCNKGLGPGGGGKCIPAKKGNINPFMDKWQ